MDKKKLTVAIVFLAVICVFALLVFTDTIKLKGKEDVTNPESNGYDVTEYCNKITTQSGVYDNPLLPTAIDGVFYSATTEGKINFYVLSEGKFTTVSATDSAKITVTLSEQDITANVSMLTKDGKTVGYGLYTTAISGDTNSIYKYAFFTLRDNTEMLYSTQYLLLVDTTEEDFRNENKIYEETFTVSKSDYSTSRFFSEANRYVGLDGTKRRDYSMMTDFLVDNASSPTLFISGRHYEENADKFDLMKTGGSGNNVDNLLVESNVICNYAKRTDNGLIYLTQNSDNKVVLMNADSEKAIKTFECSRDEIIVSGDYIYLVNDNSVYSIDEDKIFTFSDEDLKNFKADMFVCRNGKLFARGYISSVNPAIFVADTKTNECNVYVNIQFKNVINPYVLNDGSVVYTVVSVENGEESFKATVIK